MKRSILILLVALLSFSVFAQGAKEGADLSSFTGKENVPVRVTALKGPTGMGLVSLMDKSESGAVNGNEYTFELIGAPAEIPAKLLKGETDIAAIPANLASVIYNNSNGKVEVLAINTLGVLYLIGSGDEITDLSSLNGKTIYASGKGSTPEYALMHILEQAGVKANVEWKSEHAECVAAILNDSSSVALLPQPFATTAMLKNDSLHAILDLNKAWEAYSDGSALVTGVVVARTEFVKEHKDAVDQFLTDYAASTTFANESVEDAAKLVGKYNIVPEAVAKIALPKCNIVCITGAEMMEKLSGYLEVLYSQNAKAVGGKLPTNDFYYL